MKFALIKLSAVALVAASTVSANFHIKSNSFIRGGKNSVDDNNALVEKENNLNREGDNSANSGGSGGGSKDFDSFNRVD
eukprot:CAMPEP_0172533032 /NCGR_PEP_ID=MMETSP1067-20121228/5871_1 /TAXON_ID=265564 ORGANISM="Thalassiosira punctigera, Strain Tpunct2005C2" /NCGR_SAMPLE_ID=MMETSP1067 /ASSEMBLY_ACC=CAM_ASM_000444 /LENGTH=78 /DNA_ID=CAMNT_0013317617 /DNA_START=56 /DNA_END=289 /DNA_ORIENTATION=+